MKRLIFLFFIFCYPFSASSQPVRLQKTINRLTNVSGSFLQKDDPASLASALMPIILNETSIQAVVVTKSYVRSIEFRAYAKDNAIIINQPIPQTILVQKNIRREIIYQNTVVGYLRVYYSEETNVKLTTKEKNWIKNNPVVKLAPDPGFAPVEFLDQQGKYRGIIADYLKIIEKSTHLKFEILATKDWGEAIQLIKTKQAHMMGLNMITPETLNYLEFTHKFIDFPTVIIGRQGAPDKLSFEDFKNDVIHVVKGYPVEQYLQENYPQIEVKTVDSMAEGIRKISFGEIPYLSGFMPTISYQMEKQAVANIKIVMSIRGELGDSGMATRKDLPILRDILEKGLYAITQEEKRDIHKRWLSFTLERKQALQLTQAEKAWLRKHHTLNVGGPKAFPPFNYYDKTGQFHGMAADYLKIISERIGVKLKIQSNLPWPEVLKRSREHKIDLVSCIAKSPEREQFLSFSQPYLSSPLVIFVQQNAPFIGGLQDLKGKKVAVIKKGVTYDWLQRDNIAIVPHFIKTPLDGLKAVSLGTADAFIGNLAATSHMVEKEGLSNLKIAAPTSYDDYQLFMGIRKDWPELVSIVNKVLDSMTQDEKIRISRKWISLNKDSVIDYSLVWKIALGMGSIIIIIIFWALQVQRQKSALQKSEKRFRGYFEHGQIGLAVVHPELGWLEANQRLQVMLGYTLEELKKKTGADITHPDDQDTDAVLLEKMIDGKLDQYSLDKRLVHKDGAIVHTNLSISCVRGEKGKIELILASLLDITERKHMENDLIEAKDRAEEATIAKGDFLANMSHEIRTPMNAIMGMTHLCLQTKLTAKQQDYLNKAYASATSLLGLINDILDFSKIEAGKLDIELVDFSLDSVLDNVATLISAKAQEKELEFLFQIAPDVPKFLIGDPLRLGQILINLANNAVKFTQEGEVLINIALKQALADQVTLQFTVRDTGIGLSENQIAKLFQSFSQADTSTTRRFGGTGLGLTISKRLVEMMKGEIWVESEPEKGSSFIFTATLATQSVKKQSNLALAEELKGLRVLVVDDNATSRQIFKEILESFSFDVSLAFTGGKALDALTSTSTPFDLVLMDWKMPGMNGVQTSRQIKYNLKIPHIPKIIMCTSHGREEVMQQAEDLNLDSFLIKPVNPSVLLDTILEVFGKATSDETPRNAFQPVTPDELNHIRGARILLVEDNEINQQVAQELLESQGFIVEIANNGQEGVDRLTAANYDLVLMDIQMPVMGGYEAAQAIRLIPEFQNLPIVAMTANAMVGDREKAFDAGMNDHIAKPIDPKQLYSALVQFIAAGDRVIPETYLDSQPLSEPEDDLPEHLAGIDITAGLSRVGGNTKLYLSLLKKFQHNQADTVAEIQDAVSQNDMELAVRLAHTIKGVSGNIGAMELHSAAEKLESQLKDQPEAVYERLFEVVQTQIAQVFNSIDELMSNRPTDQPSKNCSVEPSQLKELFQELADFLDDDDTEAKDVLERLKSHISDSGITQQLNTIENLIDQYEFEEALLSLKKVALTMDISILETNNLL